jgi:hypothetical protein
LPMTAATAVARVAGSGQGGASSSNDLTGFDSNADNKGDTGGIGNKEGGWHCLRVQFLGEGGCGGSEGGRGLTTIGVCLRAGEQKGLYTRREYQQISVNDGSSGQCGGQWTSEQERTQQSTIDGSGVVKVRSGWQQQE